MDRKIEVSDIIECLSNGGIVLIPTDTVYGLAVSPIFQQSVNKLYMMKNRPRNLNLPIMIASHHDLENMGININENAQKLLNSSLVPGALTIALGFKQQPLLPWLLGRDEVAIRIPDDRRLISILKATGPLLVTSANKHGQPTPKTPSEILAQIDFVPDLVIDEGVCDSTPSTLINCRLNPPVIERYGAVPKSELLKFIEQAK